MALELNPYTTLFAVEIHTLKSGTRQIQKTGHFTGIYKMRQ